MVVSAHEATIDGEELVQVGRFIRRFVDQQDSDRLQMVQTLPFAGSPGRYYYRFARQRTFYLRPPQPTVINRARAVGCPVKVVTGETAFADLQSVLKNTPGAGLYLVPVHEVDRAGYQRNPEDSGQQLMKFDQHLAEVLPLVHPDDLLIVTANHGNDPAFSGEESTREWLPLLAYSPSLRGGRLADRATLADIAATIQDVLGLADGPISGCGHSFRSLLL